MADATPPPAAGHAEPSVQRTVFSVDSRSIWQVIGAILLTMVLIWALIQARDLVTMVVFSLFLSLAMVPAVNGLVRRYNMKRGSAVGLIYLGGFAFVLVMVFILIPTLATLATSIRENGATWLNDLSVWVSETFNVDLGSPGTSADASETAANFLEEWGDELLGAASGIIIGTIGAVFWMATVAMFTFYFTAQEPQLRNAVLSLFSPETQQRLGWTWDRAIQETGGYFYSRLILMVINGLGFFFTMVLVGVPTLLSIGLALIGAFIAAFIPAVGTYIGSAIPIAITLALEGLVAALIVLAYALIYQQLENYVLSPRISAGTMTLNGGLAFGAALAGGAIAGPLGAFMALPIVALISAFISHYARREEVVYQSPYDQPPPEDQAEEAADSDR